MTQTYPLQSKLTFLILTVFCLSCLNGCSSKKAKLDNDKNTPQTVNTLEYYISKKTLQDIVFEQYKLQGNKLLLECGKIRRGRYLTEEQQIIEITADQISDLNSTISDLQKSIQESNSNFEEMGKNDSAWDPGQLKLTYRTLEANKEQISTSLDSIANPTTFPRKFLKKLSAKIRDFNRSNMCLNNNFFGLTSNISN